MAAIHSLTANSDPQLAQMRLPPHSLEAEQAVLGGLLLDNSAWDRIGDVVSEGDFYRQDHRQILRAIVRQIAENRPADAVTVTEALQSLGQLESVGGLAYIVALA
ncbi:MAG: DnaB-like helicase N-terminal domain-containing protein, partial [Thiobacillus sp.]